MILQKYRFCYLATQKLENQPSFRRHSLPSLSPLLHNLHLTRRISKGTEGHASKGPISLLRDGDQPFIFEIKFFNRPYRFEFYDTASPESWKLLTPKVIVLCYDISSRLSLINVQRFVCFIILHSSGLANNCSGLKKLSVPLAQ